MRRRKSGALVALAAILIWAGTSAADVIHDSYPKISNGGFGFSGPLCYLSGNHDYDEAERFVVPADGDYALDHLRLALDWWWGNYRAVDVCLMSESRLDTVPDQVLACALPFSILSNDPVDVDVLIPDCPVLQAGTPYWIACSTSSDAYFSWNLSPGGLGYHSNRLDGGPWRRLEFGQITAFQVHATASLTAVGGGVAGAPIISLRATPNPFNPRTVICLDRAEAGRVELAVYDARGRLVRSLLHAELPEGLHRVAWDGRDDRGRGVPAGTYLAVLRQNGRSATTRLTLLR